MKRRIAILGLSGVGKSSLIKGINDTVPLLHLQASDLIKAEQAYQESTPDSSEELRTGAVVDNQLLMIAAYKRKTAATDLPVVFDGHSIIDGLNGLIEIPVSVFSELELDAICYMVADPHLIAERRRADVGRERPHRDVPTLVQHQHLAETRARQVAEAIGCPFILIGDGELGIVVDFISGAGDLAIR
ncbi:ATP-binding protein [Sphingobium aromaticiconvertens]|uniref:ATP-binding protein n=1 Tax=Sphingobium aromaticiconvertens TaxID=365341 RepID=UPI003018F7FA